MKRFVLMSALLAAAMASAPAAALAAGRLVMAPDGASVWLLTSDGRIAHRSLDDAGRSGPSPGAPGAPSSQPPEASGYADIAPSPDGSLLYALRPSADSRSTLLQALDASTFEEKARWEIRGEGRFLIVSADGSRALVAGLRPAAAGRRRPRIEEGDWSLVPIDLVNGQPSAPVIPGLAPRSMCLFAPPGAPARILLAGNDRIASYTLDPLRVSWFYKSPGDNIDVASAPDIAVVCLLRGSALAVIDPARRPRERGRVQLSEDDATSVVALPARGRLLALSEDAAVAAVLHEDGSAVTLVDVAAGRVMSTLALEAPRDLMARRILGGGGTLRLVTASSSAAVTEPAIETHAFEAPRVAAVPPAGGTPPQAPGDRPVEPQPTSPPASPAPQPAPPSQPAPAPSGPPPAPAPESPPAVEPGHDAALEPPSAPAAEPARPADGHALTGRLTGEIAAAREVLFFGPDNILRLHARAAVAADGTFRLPLPPPGSYRVVVSAGPGAHLFTRPEYRTIVVSGDAAGATGIDFEVRGRIGE